MKKYLFVVLLPVFCLTANSQVVTFKVGPTFSQLKWKNSVVLPESYFDENYIGFYTSLGLDYLLKKGFSLGSNIGYFTNGGKGSVDLTDEMGYIIGNTPHKTKLNFFTFNTIAKYTFITESNVSSYAGVGIGLNYLVSYNEELRFLKQFDDVDELNIMQWGLIGKAGINFNLNKLRFGAEFLYNYNLNDLVNYESVQGWKDKITVNYYSVLFSVGYKLN